MRWLGLVALALVGCGSTPKGLFDAGPACIVAGTDSFCSATFLCCGDAWCDSVTGHCRASSACGLDGQGCDSNHACCAGLSCALGSCVVNGNPTTGGSSTSGMTTVSCQGPAQACSVNSDCCSNVCASGNHLCAAAGQTGTGTGGITSTGTTTGGTCFGPGTGCGASTDCCSGHCNSGVCG
ncbi:MAG: hypothetical protein JST54_19360 [Deltaproteobacteria bacterium]|nr:hypothetical protein [Deltaproteobacteria bacterium]